MGLKKERSLGVRVVCSGEGTIKKIKTRLEIN
jgi:hypothetical protein